MPTKTAPKAAPKGNKIFEMAEVIGGAKPAKQLAGTGDYRNQFPGAAQPAHPGLGMAFIKGGTLSPGMVAGGWLVGVPFQQAVSQIGFQQLIGVASVPMADGFTAGVAWLMHFLLGRTSFTFGLALSSTAPFLAEGTQYRKSVV